MQMANFHGVKLPAIGMGTWHMGSVPENYAHEAAVLQFGLQNGAVAIDTAEQYGSGDAEKLVGTAIKNFPRDRIFLISKFMPNHADRQSMNVALDRSLTRLGTDYLDLYLYHWPGSTPLDQVVANLEAIRQSGKIRHWGVSNFDLADMQHLLRVPGGSHVFANEDLYNIASRGLDYDLLPWQRRHQIPLIAYAPIDQGDTRQHRLRNSHNLQVVAKRHHASVFQIMLAWAIRDSQTLAIPQTSQVNHMRSNLNSVKIKLTADDLRDLNHDFPKPQTKQPLDII